MNSLEAENDLKHFLLMAVPDWSAPRRGGNKNITRVVSKLKAIGIPDIESLVERIHGNDINESLVAQNYVELSRESLNAIRKHVPFIRNLELVESPLVRQVGQFSPVPQLLSRKRVGKLFASPPPPAAAKSRGAYDGRIPDDSGEFFHHTDRLEVDPSIYGFSGPPRAIHLRGANRMVRQHLACSEPNLNRVASGNNLPPIQTVASGAFDESLSGSLCGLEGQTSMSNNRRLNRPGSQTRANRSKEISNGGKVVEDNDSNSRSLARTTRRSSTNVMADAEDVSYNEILRLQRIGAQMRSETAPPRWTNSWGKTLEEQGEDMLEEQIKLEERTRLVRHVTTNNDVPQPFRKHIAGNIEARLRREREREAIVNLTMQQKCMNVRKQLTSMANLRRDLAGIRSRWQALVADMEDAPPPPPVQLDFKSRKPRASSAH